MDGIIQMVVEEAGMIGAGAVFFNGTKADMPACKTFFGKTVEGGVAPVESNHKNPFVLACQIGKYLRLSAGLGSRLFHKNVYAL